MIQFPCQPSCKPDYLSQTIPATLNHQIKEAYDNMMSIGEVVNLKGLAAYQDGAVVSLEILNRKTGTVTLFAFDRDQGLSEHTAPFDALVQVLEGEVEIVISGEPHLLKEGEVIIMPAGRPHALKAKSRFKMLLVMIRS